MVTVMSSGGELYAMNKWVYFCMNYPYDFIERVWCDEPLLCSHLRSKFDGDVNRFYCSLDCCNSYRLLRWILENYDGEVVKF